MKITKQQLKQLIKEVLESIAGQDVPNEDKYPELLGAIKGLLDDAFGENNYNLYKELRAMAEFKAKSGDDYSDLPFMAARTDTARAAIANRRINQYRLDIQRLVNRSLTEPTQRTMPPEPEDALENAIELTKMAAKEEFAPLVDKAAEEYKKSEAWKKILADFEI